MSDYDVSTEGGAAAGAAKLAIVPLALGVGGLVLGALGFWFGFTASGTAGQLQSQIGSMPADVQVLRQEVQQLKTQLAAQQGLPERVMRAEGAALQVADLSTRVAALETARTAAAAASAPTSTTSGRATTASGSGSGGPAAGLIEYEIQAGDTFAKLATRYGVSVDAILAANPNVNPSRLQIGQKVRIPQGR